MKKLTSVFLSVVMLMSVLCVSALASSGEQYLQARATLSEDNTTVSVEFTAAQATTNGKLTIAYDAELLSFLDADVTGIITDTKSEEGSVTLSYATTTANAIQAGERVAIVTFSVLGTAVSTDLNVTIAQFNAQEAMSDVQSAVTVNFPLSVGDMDGNGQITPRDAITLLKDIAGRRTANYADNLIAAADVNGDGKINTRDAIGILRLIVAAPIG